MDRESLTRNNGASRGASVWAKVAPFVRQDSTNASGVGWHECEGKNEFRPERLGAVDRARTCDPQLRRLQAHLQVFEF